MQPAGIADAVLAIDLVADGDGMNEQAGGVFRIGAAFVQEAADVAVVDRAAAERMFEIMGIARRVAAADVEED